ncbi:inner nuclear membrane protein enriched at telomere/subtelomere region [Mortierella alpina]|nr:inner nuclear membrane protein enriched at telomere/subtelomere region [Mortierella alpina]
MPPIKVPRYLQPDFDPLKIKMDTIREILISHNIRAPTGAVKKQELIDLFEQHIRPQAPALRKYYETVVPSEEGIIKVPRSAMTTLAFGPSDSELTSSQASTAKTVPAASKRRSAERSHHSSDLTPSRSSQSSAMGKQTERNMKNSGKTAIGIKSPKTNDGSKDVRRPDETTPRGKDQDHSLVNRRSHSKTDLEEKKRARAENFSNENPFQSGGESERRRRRSKSRESASSGSSRNTSRTRNSHRKSRDQSRDRSWDQEYNAHFNGSNQPFVLKKVKSTPKCPASLLEIKKKPYPSSPLLAKSQRIGIVTLPQPKVLQVPKYAPPVGSRTSRERTRYNLGPLRILLFILLFLYSLWYRQTRLDMGFCSSSTMHSKKADTRVLYQQALSWLYPTCIPCPALATCPSPHSEPLCPPDYSLRPHALSFGGFLPLSPFCGLDNLDEYQSIQVADAAEKVVHIKAGLQECKMYSRPPLSPALLERHRMSLEELKSDIESMKHSSVSKNEFDEYWELALRKLNDRTESLVFERVGGIVYVRSLDPSKPLKCRLRHTIVGWLIRLWPLLLGLVSTLLAGWLVFYEFSRRRRQSRTVSSMVGRVLERLQEQARQNEGNVFQSIADLFVFELDLRDALLADVEPCQHEGLWAKVATAVGSHPSVREGMQELQGDVYRVWEWRAASNSSSSKSPHSSGTRNGSSSTELSGRIGHPGHNREPDIDQVAYPSLPRFDGQGKAT